MYELHAFVGSKSNEKAISRQQKKNKKTMKTVVHSLLMFSTFGYIKNKLINFYDGL